MSALAGEADENGLLILWKRHTATPENHAEIVGLCRQYEQSLPSSPYLPVVHGLAAWHQLAAGQTEEARTNLESLVSSATTPIPRAANRMALCWLTRLDLEAVRRALTAIYADKVEFPSSLSALMGIPAARRPPLTDRWGQHWNYKLTEYAHIPGLLKQRYSLESGELGETSDLQRALKIPYASRIQLAPVQVLPSQGDLHPVTFEAPGPKPVPVTLVEDANYLKITFVHVARSLIILSDGDHWLVVPPPTVEGKQ